MAARNDAQTAVLDRGVEQRQPDRQDGGVVRLGQDDAVVLVPRNLGDKSVGEAVRNRAFRQLHANVLDGVGVDLRAEHILHQVEQSRAGQQPKDGRAHADGRVVVDARLRQTEVEVLRDGLTALLRDADQPFGKGEFRVGGRNCTPGVEIAGDFVERVGVLRQHVGDLLVGVQDVLHHHEPLILEVTLLHCAQDSHGCRTSRGRVYQPRRAMWPENIAALVCPGRARRRRCEYTAVARPMASRYTQLGIRPVINASATLTRLGGSRMPPEVLDAMRSGADAFVDMLELQRRVGARIAELTGNEACYVSCGRRGRHRDLHRRLHRGHGPRAVRRLPRDLTARRRGGGVPRAAQRLRPGRAARPARALVEIGAASIGELERGVVTPGRRASCFSRAAHYARGAPAA